MGNANGDCGTFEAAGRQSNGKKQMITPGEEGYLQIRLWGQNPKARMM